MCDAMYNSYYRGQDKSPQLSMVAGNLYNLFNSLKFAYDNRENENGSNLITSCVILNKKYNLFVGIDPNDILEYEKTIQDPDKRTQRILLTEEMEPVNDYYKQQKPIIENKLKDEEEQEEQYEEEDQEEEP